MRVQTADAQTLGGLEIDVTLEYHGWVTLMGPDDWADDDWDEALVGLRHDLGGLGPENGHVLGGLEQMISMITVTLNGLTEDPREKVLNVISAVGARFPSAYGELVVVDQERSEYPEAERFQLLGGVVEQIS